MDCEVAINGERPNSGAAEWAALLRLMALRERRRRATGASGERRFAPRQQGERAQCPRRHDVVAAPAHYDELVDALVNRLAPRRIHRLACRDEVLDRMLQGDKVHAGVAAVDGVEVAAQ